MIPETCPKCGAAKKVVVPMHGGPDVFDCGGQWFFGSGYFALSPLCLARQEIAALRERAIKAEREAQRLWRLLEEATPQGAEETP